MRILITGATGLLGGNLCYLFKEQGHDVIGTYNDKRINIPEVEFVPVADLEKVNKSFECIIHCAAKTNVDECERNPQDAHTVNTGLTERIADLANRDEALLIHISTDAVYRDSPLEKTEQSPLEPLSVYARTKLEAEKRVEAKARLFFIIRTNLFGFNILSKNSLAEWVLNSLTAHQNINGFYDVFFSPILVNDLFLALQCLITNHMLAPNSIVNIGSRNGISKYDFACAVAEDFDLDKNLITRSSVHDFGFIARRTMNSVMDSSWFEKTFNYQLPGIEECLKNFKQLYNQGYPVKLKSFNNNFNYANR